MKEQCDFEKIDNYSGQYSVSIYKDLITGYYVEVVLDMYSFIVGNTIINQYHKGEYVSRNTHFFYKHISNQTCMSEGIGVIVNNANVLLKVGSVAYRFRKQIMGVDNS
jgi:hypothetical protein